jgi:hypothetical protein
MHLPTRIPRSESGVSAWAGSLAGRCSDPRGPAALCFGGASFGGRAPRPATRRAFGAPRLPHPGPPHAHNASAPCPARRPSQTLRPAPLWRIPPAYRRLRRNPTSESGHGDPCSGRPRRPALRVAAVRSGGFGVGRPPALGSRAREGPASRPPPQLRLRARRPACDAASDSRSVRGAAGTRLRAGSARDLCGTARDALCSACSWGDYGAKAHCYADPLRAWSRSIVVSIRITNAGESLASMRNHHGS